MSLSELYLDETPIVDTDLKIVAKLPIRILSIKKTEISDKGLAYLHRCKELKHLTLSQCANLTPAGIGALQQVLPALKIENIVKGF